MNSSIEGSFTGTNTTGSFGSSLGGTLGETYGGTFDGGSTASSMASTIDTSGTDRTIVFTVQDIAKWGPLRRTAYKVSEHKAFSIIIFAIIILNTVLFTLMTDVGFSKKYGWFMSCLDSVFLGCYVAEMVLKVFALRVAYFKSGWNVFDCVIVLMSMVEWLSFISSVMGGANPAILRALRVFRTFRALRSLRVLRAISFLQNLQVLVQTVLKSIPALSSIFLLMFLIAFVYTAVTVYLFKETWPEYFGTVPRTFFTLFQLTTLDNWFDVYTGLSAHHNSALVAIILITFIILETFILMNFFVAVIVNNLEASMHQMDRWSHGRRRRARKRLMRQNVELQGMKGHGAETMGQTVAGAGTWDDGSMMNSFGNTTTTGASSIEPQSDSASDVAADTADLLNESLPRPATQRVGAGRVVEKYYADIELDFRERSLIGMHWQLLASIESQFQSYMQKLELLDDLVDATVTMEEDPNE